MIKLRSLRTNWVNPSYHFMHLSMQPLWSQYRGGVRNALSDHRHWISSINSLTPGMQDQTKLVPHILPQYVTSHRHLSKTYTSCEPKSGQHLWCHRSLLRIPSTQSRQGLSLGRRMIPGLLIHLPSHSLTHLPYLTDNVLTYNATYTAMYVCMYVYVLHQNICFFTPLVTYAVRWRDRSDVCNSW